MNSGKEDSAVRWHTGETAEGVFMEAFFSKLYFCISNPQTSKDLFSVTVGDNAAIKALCWNDFWDVFTFSFLNRLIEVGWATSCSLSVQPVNGIAVGPTAEGPPWELCTDFVGLVVGLTAAFQMRWGAFWRWTLGKWHYCEENGAHNAIFFW